MYNDYKTHVKEPIKKIDIFILDDFSSNLISVQFVLLFIVLVLIRIYKGDFKSNKTIVLYELF